MQTDGRQPSSCLAIVRDGLFAPADGDVPMTIAFIILNSVIVLVPALMVLSAPMTDGWISAALAIALTAVAAAMPKAMPDRVLRALGRLAVVILLVPALWMLVQLFPLQSEWLVNPVWVSASAAMDKPVLGAITVDIGATLLALARYVLLLAAGLLTLAIALNRQYAQNVLAMTTAVATFVALSLIAIDLGYLGLIGIELSRTPNEALTIAILGSITASALVIDASRHRDIRNRMQPEERLRKRLAMVAVVICLAAVAAHESLIGLIAALFGIGVLASITIIRVWRFGPWGYAGVAAATAVALIGFFSLVPPDRGADLSLVWSGRQEMAATERMLANARWSGSGAGTTSAIAPFYRQADDSEAATHSPPAAAAIAIEMGRPFLVATLLVMLAAAGWLFHSALRRGRDYIYAGAGAGCLVALVLCLFIEAGPLELGAALMASIILGLALAQRKGDSQTGAADPSRTIRAALAAAPSSGHPAWPGEMSRSVPLRSALVAVSVVLTAQAAWILLAELGRPTDLAFPLDQREATAMRPDQSAAHHAAARAMVRGDLWADSAFSLAGVLWPNPAAGGSGGMPVQQILEALTKALRYAPHRGDMWLMLADLTSRYGLPGLQPDPLLKMSFYTAPSKRELISTRIATALRAKTLPDDDELQDMVRRDIALAVSDRASFQPFLSAAYAGAPPQGKAFADRVIADIDPAYTNILRATHPHTPAILR